MIMSVMTALAVGQAVDMSPIDVPYQAMEAYQAYTSCVGSRFVNDPRIDGEPGEVRQAHLDAVAACRETREEQLRRALRVVTDYRPYGGSEVRAKAAVRRAFDRFDRDVLIESASEQGASTGKAAAPDGN